MNQYLKCKKALTELSEEELEILMMYFVDKSKLYKISNEIDRNINRWRKMRREIHRIEIKLWSAYMDLVK